MMNTRTNGNTGFCGDVNGALPNGSEWVVIKKLSNLNPSKILGYEGYYTAGAGGNGNGQYWVYNRHLAMTTTTATTVTKYRGVSNYLFNDGHVESNGDYHTKYPSAVRPPGTDMATAYGLSPWGGDPPFPY
jgi:prepilin-type processing-associated H-X9-DG protein